MTRHPPIPTLTDTPFPYPTLFRPRICPLMLPRLQSPRGPSKGRFHSDRCAVFLPPFAEILGEGGRTIAQSVLDAWAAATHLARIIDVARTGRSTWQIGRAHV